MRSVTLGAVCEFKPSKRLAKASLSETDSVSFVPMNELGIHQMHLAPHEQRSLSEVIGSYTYFADGDVLLAKITPCFENGKLGVARGLTNGVGFGSSEFMVIRPSCEILPEYLYYFLEREEVRQTGAKVMTGAVGHKRVPQEFIESLEITLPPIKEQQRIVAVLDEAFTAIATATANAEKNLANAKQLFDAAFRERFDHAGDSWGVYRLPEIAENWDYLRRPVTKSDRIAGEVPYYGASGQVDSVRNYLFDEDLLLISEDGANLLMRTYPIAFSIAGKAWVNNHAHILKFSDIATQRLVEYYINSISIAPWVSGMAQPKLNQKALNSIPVPLPPEIERKKLVAELDDLAGSIAKLEASQEARLSALAALKQSLLHRAFTGEMAASKPIFAAPANDDWTSPEAAAQILVFAHFRHVALNRVANFGHVKAQKSLQAVEAWGGLDLGRQPIKDRAGPNDFPHMRRVEEWAKQNGAFEFVERPAGGYDFRPLQNYSKLLDDARRRLNEAGASPKRAIDLLVDMDSDWAEIIVTTHAAWNNLILDKAAVADDTIAYAARDGWHQSKLRHEKLRFHDAIRFLRSNGLVPDGSAKRVGGQEAMLF